MKILDSMIALTAMGVGTLLAAEPRTPNIVLILADDLGFGDLSCFNPESQIHTDNIDRLASEGIVFTEAHSGAAVSTPSRYGLLTGRYCWRSYLKSGVLPHYHYPLMDPARTTLAGLLRSRGYETACIGKWHLGFNFPTLDGKDPVDNETTCNIDYSKEMTGGPCDVGFDYFYGLDAPNYPPFCFIENRKTVVVPDSYLPPCKKLHQKVRGGRMVTGWKLEDILPSIEKRAVAWIEEQAESDRPFFLYFPLTSPHEPIKPSEEFLGSSGLNVYADFVLQTDSVVGSVLDALKRTGMEENTIVIFTSDNGCSPNADFEFLLSHGHDPSGDFRGMKADLYEGGHHMPLIVRWPSVCKPAVSDSFVSLTDFMATFAELTGYKLSANEGEDSFSLLPILEGRNEPARKNVIYHSIHGHFSIQEGKWKLLTTSYSGGWSEPKRPVKDGVPYQLYDMEKDPGETTNLYEVYPEIARSLAATLAEQILNGRSTPGIPQKNDVEEPWPQISWISDPGLVMNGPQKH